LSRATQRLSYYYRLLSITTDCQSLSIMATRHSLASSSFLSVFLQQTKLILFIGGPPSDSVLHSIFNCSSYNLVSVAPAVLCVGGIRPDAMERFCLTYTVYCTSHPTFIPNIMAKFHARRLKEIKTQQSTATNTCTARLPIA